MEQQAWQSYHHTWPGDAAHEQFTGDASGWPPQGPQGDAPTIPRTPSPSSSPRQVQGSAIGHRYVVDGMTSNCWGYGDSLSATWPMHPQEAQSWESMPWMAPGTWPETAESYYVQQQPQPQPQLQTQQHHHHHHHHQQQQQHMPLQMQPQLLHHQVPHFQQNPPQTPLQPQQFSLQPLPSQRQHHHQRVQAPLSEPPILPCHPVPCVPPPSRSPNLGHKLNSGFVGGVGSRPTPQTPLQPQQFMPQPLPSQRQQHHQRVQTPLSELPILHCQPVPCVPPPTTSPNLCHKLNSGLVGGLGSRPTGCTGGRSCVVPDASSRPPLYPPPNTASLTAVSRPRPHQPVMLTKSSRSSTTASDHDIPGQDVEIAHLRCDDPEVRKSKSAISENPSKHGNAILSMKETKERKLGWHDEEDEEEDEWEDEWNVETKNKEEATKDEVAQFAAWRPSLGVDEASLPGCKATEAASRWARKDGKGKEPAPMQTSRSKTGNEKSWEAAVHFHDETTFKIGMAGRSVDDDLIGSWCSWFQDYMNPYVWDKGFVASEVDFSRNRLTSIGVRKLLNALQRSGVSVWVLKLHHNQLERSDDVASLVAEGDLSEVHLSHNYLDSQSSAKLVLAAAKAWDSTNHCHWYPRDVKGVALAPLWLRLEQNFIDYTLFDRMVKVGMRRLKRSERLLCYVDGTKGCTPHTCMACSIAPIVHVPYLMSQRLDERGGHEC